MAAGMASRTWPAEYPILQQMELRVAAVSRRRMEEHECMHEGLLAWVVESEVSE